MHYPCSSLCLTIAVGVGVSVALMQPPAKPAEKAKAPATAQPPAKPAEKTPPGKPDDAAMKAMEEAYTKAAQPGKEHEHLMKSVGTWDGKVKEYQMPGQPPKESTCVSVISGVMGGRFTKCDVTATMMNQPFTGMGLYGFDNATQKYQCTWIDNFGTGMMTGTGELSADGKTMTWTMHATDPVSKKPMSMREVDRFTDDNTTVMEMYGTDPMSNQEMKMIEITSKRRAGSAGAKPETKAPAPSK